MTPERKGKFTRGPLKFVPWHINEAPAEVQTTEAKAICQIYEDEYGPLFAAAGTSATTCEYLGLDGQKCVEMLPEMVKALESVCVAIDPSTCSGAELMAYHELKELLANLKE